MLIPETSMCQKCSDGKSVQKDCRRYDLKWADCPDMISGNAVTGPAQFEPAPSVGTCLHQRGHLPGSGLCFPGSGHREDRQMDLKYRHQEIVVCCP
jgi:hypothetical protein